MRCFKCRALVPDGTAICPHCDTILDPSFLDEATPVPGAEPPDSTADAAPSEAGWPEAGSDDPLSPDFWDPEARTEPPVTAPPPAAEETNRVLNRNAAAEPAPPGQATRILSQDPERDKETRIVQPPPPPRLPPHRAAEAAGEEDSILSSDFDAAVDGLRQVYARLNSSERISLWCTVAAFVGAFLPWYYVRGYGLLSGIQTHGLAVAGLTLAALVLLYVRYHLRLGMIWSLFQLLCTAGAAFIGAYFLVEPAMAHVRFGLPASAVAAGAAVVTGFSGLFKRT